MIRVSITSNFFLAVAIGMVVVGCADNGPTKNNQDTVIPTLNLSDQIILGMSGPFNEATLIDSTTQEYALQLPLNAISTATANADIQLKYLGPEPCRLAQVYVFDFADSVWVKVEDQRTPSPCFGQFGGTSLVLLPFDRNPIESFVSSSGVMRIKGDLNSPSATVLQMHPHYHPILLSVRAFSQEAVCIGDKILVLIKQDEHPGEYVDSLIWLDRFGERTFEGDMGIAAGGGYGIGEIRWSGHDIWLNRGGRYMMVDPTGLTVGSFTHQPPHPDSGATFSQSFAWVRGEFWISEIQYTRSIYHPTQTPYINVIDAQKSIDSGYSIVTRSFALDQSLLGIGELLFDGIYVCGMTRYGIVRMIGDGHIVDTLPLPVLPAYSMTWDGEAFWIVHSGPIDVNTDHFLLSRFYPR